MVLALAIGHTVNPAVGSGVGFGIFIAFNILAIILSKSPDSRPPGLLGKKQCIVQDVVVTILLSPILAIIVSFALPLFYTKRNDPLHIFAFASTCGVMCIVAVGFILPRWFDVFVPPEKLHLCDTFYAPQVVMAPLEVRRDEVIEHEQHAGEGRAREGNAEPRPRKKPEAQSF
ncbi:hypothetical protein H9Q72_009910 [Fusarium xylarioides]|uniref:Uncharacterized protein n=1 Tax=Fusarium xylarioides TaxID=221167 RepID=A0A9P7HJU4_9HYPO|nr:hypothetical protein H9Q72_009910 [Fusarium xylarioides]KAG5804314.1 hypothetical protein H9Q71_011108 [Fusarium xylarioides]KAG5824752.1 hypothetical protein H9Q74_005159 [Fusarium xylarioides]